MLQSGAAIRVWVLTAEKNKEITDTYSLIIIFFCIIVNIGIFFCVILIFSVSIDTLL